MSALNLNLQISFLAILVADLFIFILYFDLCKLELIIRSTFITTFALGLFQVSVLFRFVT